MALSPRTESARTMKACRTSRQLADTSWQASSALLDMAIRMMAASLVVAMLLMGVACAMCVVTLTLNRIDATQR